MPRPQRPRRKCVVRYHTPDGRRCRKSDPGAVKTTEQTATWYASIGGEDVSLETTDEAQAWAELRRLQREGQGQPRAPKPAPGLADHVTAWLADVQAEGAGADHVAKLRYELRLLTEAADWKRLADLTDSSCRQALAAIQSARGVGPKTRNDYLAAAKQFAAWLVAGDRLRRNPFLSLAALPEEVDRRHRRRRPTDAEVRALFTYLATPAADITSFRHTFRTGKTRWYGCRMTGTVRAQCYRVAMGTGFRASEVRSLERSGIDLDGATATVRAAFVKNRKLATQPLPPWLVEELRAYFAAGHPCWSAMPAESPGRVLQHDLAAAGVPYALETADGIAFFDWHCLRVFYISALADDPTITIKVLQTLARHSDPSLTLRVYAQARQEAVRTAAERLPPPGS